MPEICRIVEAIEKIDGTGEIEVGLIWDPPWSPELMSEDAKLALGMSCVYCVNYIGINDYEINLS